jgi:hypothetical protein
MPTRSDTALLTTSSRRVCLMDDVCVTCYQINNDSTCVIIQVLTTLMGMVTATEDMHLTKPGKPLVQEGDVQDVHLHYPTSASCATGHQNQARQAPRYVYIFLKKAVYSMRIPIFKPKSPIIKPSAIPSCI